MDLERFHRIGYATEHAGEVSDVFIAQHDLLCVRGMIVDGIFPNDRTGRAIVKKALESKVKKEA
jgi:hypothetical protein